METYFRNFRDNSSTMNAFVVGVYSLAVAGLGWAAHHYSADLAALILGQ